MVTTSNGNLLIILKSSNRLKLQKFINISRGSRIGDSADCTNDEDYDDFTNQDRAAQSCRQAAGQRLADKVEIISHACLADT